MISQPPSAARAIFLISRAALKRRINKIAGNLNAAFRKKKKPQDASAPVQDITQAPAPALTASRTATVRKTRGGGILLIFFAGIMLFNGINLSSQFLRVLRDSIENVDTIKGIPVDTELYELVSSTEKTLIALNTTAPVTHEMRVELERKRTEKLETLKQALATNYRLITLSDEERSAAVESMMKVFEEKGAAGFRIQKRREISFLPGTDLWPEHEDLALRALGLIFLFLNISMFFMAMGSANQDLGKVEWSTEWLFTFPIKARVLFLAKVFEFAVTNAICWFISLPLFFTVFWCAGYSYFAVPLAFLVSAYVAVTVASFYVVAETWFRNALPPNRIKNLQAVFSVIGSLMFFTMIWTVASPSGAPFVLKLLPHFQADALWNPLSLPAKLCARNSFPGLTLALLAGISTVFIYGSVLAAEWMVRSGLLGSANPYHGERRVMPSRGKTGPFVLGGIVGKELRLLLRDRNFLVQSLIVPLLILGFQLVMNPALMSGATGNYRHAAALAFGLGAYVLIFSAFQVLSAEGNALWMLYTFPQPLYAVLLRKTLLWCVFASFYTISILAACALMNPTLDWNAMPDALTAIAGVIIYSLIASGIGVLGTDPLEVEVQRKIRPEMHYLYMLLATLYGYAIYSQSQWSKIAQIILSALLAFALWQKVRDHTPYLLDPTEEPPPQIGLSDGMIAALAFFVLQGLVMLMTTQFDIPNGARLVIAFVSAGFIVTFSTLYVFWRQKVPNLLRTVGLRRPAVKREASFVRAILVGIAGGSAAAMIALFYLNTLEWWAPLKVLKEQMLKEESLKMAAQSSDDNPIWFGLLAVLAAPLFEEYIFRGLVYKGLRRSVNTIFAALASACIFAIVHPPVSAIPVFVLGFTAALIFEREKLLIAPIVAHMVYNGMIVWLHMNK